MFIYITDFVQGGFYVDSGSEYDSSTEIRSGMHRMNPCRITIDRENDVTWSFICYDSAGNFQSISESYGYKEVGTVIDLTKYNWIRYIRIELHSSGGIEPPAVTRLSVDYAWEKDEDTGEAVDPLFPEMPEKPFVTQPRNIWRTDKDTNDGIPFHRLIPEYSEPPIGAFMDAAALEYVYIPPTVRNIGRYAFSGTALQSVKVHEECSFYPTSFPERCRIFFFDHSPEEYIFYGDDTDVFSEFPAVIETEEDHLTDWKLYGSEAGTGDKCLNEIPLPHYRPTFTNRGITYASNEDGTVVANGTADYPNGSSYDVLANDISPEELAGRTYTMSAADTVTEGVFIILYFYAEGSQTVTPVNVEYRYEGETEWRKASSSVQTRAGNTYHRSVTIRFNDVENVVRCQLQIRAFDGTALENFTYRPMFFEGEEYQPFDVYGKYKLPTTSGEHEYMIYLPSPLGASGDDADELSYSEQAVTYRAGRSEPETVPVDVPAIETLPDFAETIISFGTQAQPGKVSLTFRGWHYN